MATVAVVAASAATVAAAGAQAYSASAKGKGAKGGGPSVPETPLWEKLFNRGTADLMEEERRTMEDALSQANFLQPEMYKLLGFEPVYDQADPGVGEKSATFEKLQGQWNTNKQRILDIGEALKGGGKSLSRYDRKALRRERNQLNKVQPNLGKQVAQAQRELGDAQTNGRKVVGFKKLDQPADPTQSRGDLFRMALDLENETLVRALKGEEPIDATLRTQWDEKERAMRERLRRTVGPDYETSSAGIEALANFDREKAQSFETYNRAVVGQFSQLTESRATALSNLTGAKLQQMLFPANAQAQRALLLGQAGGDRLAFSRSQREERGQKFESEKARYNAEAANAQARADAIAGIGQALGGVGQGLAGFGTSDYAKSIQPLASAPTSAYTGEGGGGGYSGAASLDYGDSINRYLGR